MNIGLCSRREADRYLASGQVSYNNTIISIGSSVPSDAILELSPSALFSQEDKKSIVYHKPLGIVSCQPEGYTCALSQLTLDNLHSNACHQFKIPGTALPKLGVCGRLDVNSTGLLLFTQDGRIATSILNNIQNPVEKEYLVRMPNYTHKMIVELQGEITCGNDILKAKRVEKVNDDQLRMVLTEGKHHHIRRMCYAVGGDIVALKRVRIGSVKLGALPVGKWCYWNPGLNDKKKDKDE